MKQYIEREAVHKALVKLIGFHWADELLSDIPAADVVERKPIKTNADKIRQMSDEELERFLRSANACPMFADDSYTCKTSGCHSNEQPSCWFDWLKQEVESDG